MATVPQWASNFDAHCGTDAIGLYSYKAACSQTGLSRQL